MTTFLEKNEPNFIFKGLNAATDMGCIIEKELPDIQAQPNIEEISIIGRSGTLTEWYGDYKPYDLNVGAVTIPYENLEDVKRWLSGSGKFISHNDLDKVIDAAPSFSSPLEFGNEWGVFYTFDLTFRCQPLKRKVNEQSIKLYSKNTLFNPGSERSFPIFEVETSGGSLKINCNDVILTIPSMLDGAVKIDCENGLVIQNGRQLRTIGEWPEIVPGENNVSITGGYSGAKILLRSAWT